MNMKEHILAALSEQLTRWEELLARLSEAQITAPRLPDNRSIKDDIAHLRTWQQRSIARMEAGLFNREPELPVWQPGVDPDATECPDETNAWIYETTRDQPWSEVHSSWRAGFQWFLEVGAWIPERDLLDGSWYPWLNGLPLVGILVSSYDHHQEHYEKLMAWLEAHGS